MKKYWQLSLLLACVFVLFYTLDVVGVDNPEMFMHPSMGKVKRVYDSAGQPTKYFRPVIEDAFTLLKMSEAYHFVGKSKELIEILNTAQDLVTRRQAVEDLCHVTGDETKIALEALVKFMDKETDSKARKETLAAISSILVNGDMPDSDVLDGVKIFEKYLTDNDPTTRGEAAVLLIYFGEYNKSKEVILKDLADERLAGPENYDRMCLPAALARLEKDDAIVNVLKKTLSNNNEYIGVRLSATMGLVNIDAANSSDFEWAKVEAEKNEDKWYRIQALDLLAAVANKDTSVLKTLENASKNDVDDEVKEYVLQKLANIKK
ncbi:MAG: hypothetical protein WC955_04085 [Elusimicrobiota bacterium]